jgi:hypothetical protein
MIHGHVTLLDDATALVSTVFWPAWHARVNRYRFLADG